MRYGIVNGRFQLFHNGHLNNLILPAKDKCEHLVIGICNPSVEEMRFDSTNPHRSEVENNPFSYWERYLMIKNSLIEVGIAETEFSIVPFPINFPAQIRNYIPREGVHFLTIYDEWGRRKLSELQDQGFNVEVLKELSIQEKGYSASDLRTMIKEGNPQWEECVPKAVVTVVSELHLDQKLMKQQG